MSTGSIDRLLASRARIAQALAAPPPLPAQSLTGTLLQAAAGGNTTGAGIEHWLEAALRAAVHTRVIAPIQQHPLPALTAAFGAGALLALARPWRWRLPTPLLLALVTQVGIPWATRRHPHD